MSLKDNFLIKYINYWIHKSKSLRVLACVSMLLIILSLATVVVYSTFKQGLTLYTVAGITVFQPLLLVVLKYYFYKERKDWLGTPKPKVIEKEKR